MLVNHLHSRFPTSSLLSSLLFLILIFSSFIDYFHSMKAACDQSAESPIFNRLLRRFSSAWSRGFGFSIKRSFGILNFVKHSLSATPCLTSACARNSLFYRSLYYIKHWGFLSKHWEHIFSVKVFACLSTVVIMDSNSQDSPVDIDDIQPIIDTPSSDTSISTSPQQSPTTTPCLTPKFPEDTDGDHLPATPPTPDPWMWKCHKCLKKYKFEATTRCLDDGHYFCQTPNSKRNRLRDDMKQKDYRICKSIFDSTGWEKFKAWQKKVRLAHGKEGEWESGCMNDCKRPYYCSSVLATPPATFGQGWLSATAVIDKAIDKAASSEDQVRIKILPDTPPIGELYIRRMHELKCYGSLIVKKYEPAQNEQGQKKKTSLQKRRLQNDAYSHSNSWISINKVNTNFHRV